MIYILGAIIIIVSIVFGIIIGRWWYISDCDDCRSR
jgi:hypothetical protein